MIVGLMNVYNEEEYIAYSAGCLYPFVDKLVVIDGCDKLFPGAETNPSSSDNTEKILKELDTQGKLVYVKSTRPWNTFADQRAALLEYCPSGSKCIMLDGDEVLKPADIKLLLKALDRYEMIGVRHHHFFSDFYTKKSGYSWDGWVIRAWRMRDDFIALHHGFFSLKHNGKSILDPENEGLTKLYSSPDIYVYHYGYVRSMERILQKFTYYYQRKYPNTRQVMPWKQLLEVENYFKPGWWDGSDWTGIYCKTQLVRFKGKHPSIMRDHPMNGVKRIRKLPGQVRLLFHQSEWPYHSKRYGPGIVEEVKVWDLNIVDDKFFDFLHTILKEGGVAKFLLSEIQLNDTGVMMILMKKLNERMFSDFSVEPRTLMACAVNHHDRYGWDYDKKRGEPIVKDNSSTKGRD